MNFLLALLDVLLSPAVLAASILLKGIRRGGVQRFPVSRRIFRAVGVFPIRDHYFEPLFHPRHLKKSLREDRDLPGIDLNVQGQLELLSEFRFSAELESIPREPAGPDEFYYDNPSFQSGDAEMLYNMIRRFKPRRLIEIGAGYSTLLAHQALERNRRESPEAACRHIVIEPFEHPWLERIGCEVVRDLVETSDARIFSELDRNDILFIDSSHVIRPQGDVLFEYLTLLPRLRPGVLVHVHDIFTPKDYLDEWIKDRVHFWNEQYLLEGFLTLNRDYRVLAAVNFLKHHHFEALSKACPMLSREPDREPGSFWMARV